VARRVVDLAGAEVLGQGARRDALLEGGVGADGDADVLAREAARRSAMNAAASSQRPLEALALAQQRAPDAIGVVDVLVAEADAVVDPGLVDLGVEAALDALDAAGAGVDHDGRAEASSRLVVKVWSYSQLRPRKRLVASSSAPTGQMSVMLP
jgi:hypothetical protein